MTKTSDPSISQQTRHPDNYIFPNVIGSASETPTCGSCIVCGNYHLHNNNPALVKTWPSLAQRLFDSFKAESLPSRNLLRLRLSLHPTPIIISILEDWHQELNISLHVTRQYRPPFTMSTLRETDDVLQGHLGHTPELKRKFSSLSMLGLAFAILNSWTALSASLSLALPSGGPTSVIWGLVTAGVCNLCLAASLAEFLSAWPTAGGQYRK